MVETTTLNSSNIKTKKTKIFDKVYNLLVSTIFNPNNGKLKAVIFSITQLLIFILTKSYVLYFLFGIMFLLCKNIHLIKSIENIKHLKETLKIKLSNRNTNTKSKLSNNRSKISMLKKISTLSLDYTDAIVISTVLGHHASLLYSNYDTILSSLSDLFESVYEIIFEKVNLVYLKLNLKSKIAKVLLLTVVSILVYVTISLLMFHFFNHFIKEWAGHKSLLRKHTVYTLILNFCLSGILIAAIKNRKILGLFHTEQFNPFILITLNIILSISLSKYFGITGVIFGSILSKVIVNLIYEALIVYNVIFKSKIRAKFLILKKFSLIFLPIIYLVAPQR
ncbi:MAG: hypothetical protein ACRC41_09215 [Sarcina sp.]